MSNDPSYDQLKQLIVDYNDITSIVELEGTKFIDNFMLFSITHNKLSAVSKCFMTLLYTFSINFLLFRLQIHQQAYFLLSLGRFSYIILYRVEVAGSRK